MIYLLFLLLLFPVAIMLFYKFRLQKPAVDYQHPRILMYHMVSAHKKGARFNKLRVTPQNFEKQIHWLRNDGWTFVTLSELAATKATEKRVAITFDDGFEDNYLEAFPVLKKYAAKATLYLVVDRHNRDWSTYKKAHHNSGELMREPKLSDAQVKEMLDSGLIELGGHTLTHANLSALSTDAKITEIGQCRQSLTETFDTPVSSFAYPFGIYSPEDVALVANAGYSNAVTTQEGIDSASASTIAPAMTPFELKRVKISGKDSLRTFQHRMRYGTRK
jgi:peptidoglycan/xylan/chitin deacetylase (PgdA/CDA1 family)